jgi:gluconokinase
MSDPHDVVQRTSLANARPTDCGRRRYARGVPGYTAPVSVRVVVMGVAGSGKTTIGQLLAVRLGVDFADADDFHTPENIAKMRAGIPLDDEDRWPWLEAIAAWLADHADTGGVVTCSALRRAYRDVLRRGATDAWFLHLVGSPALMAARVRGRGHHFMPAELVESQFEELEPPDTDERAVELDASLPPEQIVDRFFEAINLDPADVP